MPWAPPLDPWRNQRQIQRQNVETRIVFTIRPLLPATKKDALPGHHHNVIYKFVCHCDSRYVERTSQRLQARIKQHVPRSTKNHHSCRDRINLFRACKINSTSQIIAHDSVIALDSIFWKTLPVLANIVTINPPSLLEDVLLSTFPLLKLLLSNFVKSIYVDTRNFFTVSNSFINALLLSLLIGCLSSPFPFLFFSIPDWSPFNQSDTFSFPI